MALTKGCEEVVHSCPLFLTIYTVVVVVIVVSSLYVFSAIYSNNSSAHSSFSFSSSSLSVKCHAERTPEEELGPRIDIREYSILDNPSLPSKVHGSTKKY